MRISTKLLILLFFCAVPVMTGAVLLTFHQYELFLEKALLEDLQAHAVTLKIALEEKLQDDLTDGNLNETQKLLDRLRENTEIYSVLLFDKNENLIAQSTELNEDLFRRPPELSEVLNGNDTESQKIIRRIGSRKFAFSILALKVGNETIGAFEIVKPLSLIENDIYYARINWLLTLIILLSVIFVTVFYVLRRNITKPIDRLLSAVEAVGKGDLRQQVEITERRDEIGKLAEQFNQMAENLREQRRTSLEEAENRLKLERRLRHNEQLASVGRLAAGVAHELGAPLNVIDARAEQILKKPDIAPEKQRKKSSNYSLECGTHRTSCPSTFEFGASV